MRLISVWISEYKKLRDFSFSFSGERKPFGETQARPSIEHLFCDPTNMTDNFRYKEVVGGQVIEFCGEKIPFAQEISQITEVAKFECFRSFLEDTINN